MNIYDISVLVMGACTLCLYLGCVLHYRDLKSAQDIVREVAFNRSADAEAPYQQIRALSLFLADVVSVPDFRTNLAKTGYNVYKEYGPQAEFPRYFGRQLVDDYMTLLHMQGVDCPPYMAHLSHMDAGEFVIQAIKQDKIVQEFLNAYVREGFDYEAIERIEANEAEIIDISTRERK